MSTPPKIIGSDRTLGEALSELIRARISSVYVAPPNVAHDRLPAYAAGIITERDVLRALTHTGTTIFFSSHIMEVVERLCTRVGIINHGRLVAEGTLDELRRGAGDEDGTLEEVFLTVVGAGNGGRSLSWLE